MEIKTGRQKRLELINKKVSSMYETLHAENPNASDNAIFTTIAKELDYTPNGIRRIIKSLES